MPELGSDMPADLETTGYFSKHFSFIAKNLTGMVDFYTTIFGFRHFITIPVSEHVSFIYMGHAHGARNGSGYQTAAELAREKNNAAGLLELVYVNVTDNDIPCDYGRYQHF
jgi:lactoylglutathione lyase